MKAVVSPQTNHVLQKSIQNVNMRRYNVWDITGVMLQAKVAVKKMQGPEESQGERGPEKGKE